MRRILGIALGTTLVVVVGAGAVAWAGPGRGDPGKREAAKQCLADARAANPDADKAAIREAAKPCLEAAGIAPKELTAQQQARRDAAKACLQAAKEANPDADRPDHRRRGQALPGGGRDHRPGRPRTPPGLHRHGPGRQPRRRPQGAAHRRPGVHGQLLDTAPGIDEGRSRIGARPSVLPPFRRTGIGGSPSRDRPGRSVPGAAAGTAAVPAGGGAGHRPRTWPPTCGWRWPPPPTASRGTRPPSGAGSTPSPAAG